MAVRDQRMQRQHQALTALTRSDPFLRGDVEQALRAINRTACTTLGVARSSIWLYDEARTRVDCCDLFIAAEDSHHSGLTLSAADYPAYFEALLAERTIAARDAHTHPATREFSAGYLKPLGIDAMLDAPIIVAGRMVGVVCQEHTGGVRDWEIDEELFVGSIADMVALTLESSRRRSAQIELETVVNQLERRLAQVQGMVEVAQSIISVLDVNLLLEKIMDTAKKVMHAEASSLLLLDREQGVLRFQAARGTAAGQFKEATIKLGHGLAGWVAERGEPLLIPDAYADPRFDRRFDEQTNFRTRSILTVPLLGKDGVLGVLQVINKLYKDCFDEQDLDLFRSFASMGSIALENARLFAQTRQMAADLRTALEKERWLAIEKQKMGAYIPKHVLDEISRSREQKLALGGKSVVASVLFSDIKGFTSVSEQLRPEVVVTFLNEYMTAMANVVEAEEGLVDKFIGDGVMAVFLPRGEGDNHALRAVRASIRMQQELARLKLRWRTTRPEVANLLMRVGINTGEMIAGNVGSETRMDYTVIGDNVNVASRIESNGIGGQIHISEATYAEVGDSIQAVRLEPIQVKNRVRPVQIYSVVFTLPESESESGSSG